jgi:hypothetical protein
MGRRKWILKEEIILIRCITRQYYNSLCSDYKMTLKEHVEFETNYHGYDAKKFYEDLGYDVDKDVMILEGTERGTVLAPAKIID